jgi:hypothetical protein
VQTRHLLLSSLTLYLEGCFTDADAGKKEVDALHQQVLCRALCLLIAALSDEDPRGATATFVASALRDAVADIRSLRCAVEIGTVRI